MTPQEKLIAAALAEVGYLEKASNADLDSDTANAGKKNFTKYARDLDALGDFYNGKKNGYDWCDVFVDWCFVQAFGKVTALKLLCTTIKSCGAGCRYSADYYQNKKQFHTSKPQPGDQIFFGSGNTWQHTGLVVKVDSKYVYTVEGNTSGASGVVANGGGVAEKKYLLTYNRILGYGRPDWSVVEATAAPSPAAPKKSVDEIAKEVLAGKWGSGATRKAKLTEAGYNYSEVQKKVNALVKGTTEKSVDEITREVIAGKWGSGAERKKKLTAAGYNYTAVQKKVNQLLK